MREEMLVSLPRDFGTETIADVQRGFSNFSLREALLRLQWMPWLLFPDVIQSKRNQQGGGGKKDINP